MANRTQKKHFYFLGHLFIIKGYHSGTAQWTRCPRQGCARPARLPCPLQAALSQRLRGLTNLEAPESCLCFCGGFSHRHDRLNHGHWHAIHPPAPLPSLGGQGGAVLTLESQGWFSWQPAPPALGAFQSHLINRTKDPFSLSLVRKYQGL